jgi:uncharacterized protein (DUF58 family)
VATYQLGLPRLPVAGRSGELLGRGVGSSLEFQEFRQYIPGDDIRHLDWAAYARSDQLMVRMYREEISPRTEILVDTSRSMNSGEAAKPLLTRQLAALFALLSARSGGRPTLLPLSDQLPLRSVGVEGLDVLYATPFTAQSTLAELLNRNLIPLKAQAVRIVISDFLFPHDPGALIRKLAAGASVLWVIQLLNEWEAQPTPLGGRRIIDIETGAETDLMLDRKTVAAYLQRLGALQEELMRHCRRTHAPFVTLIADRGLDALCRLDLTAAGMLRVG